MIESGYPGRSKFFAHRYCRLLAQSESAQELGPEVCWLLTVIVHQEDANRYRGPVTFWNEQLTSQCGMGSVNRLHRARLRAIDAGFLHYVQGGKSRIGQYWVTVCTGMA